MREIQDGAFDVGWDSDKKTITIEYRCCDHEEEHGKECIHLTPEKAVFMAQLLLQKVLTIYWAKSEEKPDDKN